MNANRTHKTHGPGRRGGAGRRGFTAIELSAVASIIAILALILVPIVRGRLLEAQIAAALDDMHSIEVAQVSAFADTNFHYRLSDLDNTIDLDSWNGGMNPFALQQTPGGSWNRPFLASQLPDFTTPPPGASPGTIASNWKGPYINYHNLKYIPLFQLRANPEYTRGYDLGGGGVDGDRGPIVVFTGSGAGDPAFDDFHNETLDPGMSPQAGDHFHPVDPWGNPYFFFGTGRWGDGTGIDYGPHAQGLALVGPPGVGQFAFGNCMVFSLGPDGLVGGDPMNPPVPPSAPVLFRERIMGPGNTWIGAPESDDLVRFF